MTTNRENVIAIKPGILVGLHCTIDGGREYATKGLESEREGRKEITSWETTRTIRDAAEYKRAEDARGQCRRLIEAACIRTDFGPLCPLDRESDLWAAITESRRIAEDFNAGAAFSRVRVLVLPARVAANDAEAAYSIAGEVRRLIDEMQDGIKALDVAAVRDACNRARRLGAMLDDSQASKVNDAIDAARKVARDVVRRVEKGGEVADTVIAELKQESSAIDAARFAFLDLEQKLAPEGTALPAVNVQRFAEVEVEAAPDLSQPDAATVAYLDKVAPEDDPDREPVKAAQSSPVPAYEIPDADPEPVKTASAADARDLDLFSL